MRKDAYGFTPSPVKTRKPRLKRCRYDELEEIRELKAAYGNNFFSPALMRIIKEKIYKQ